MVAPGTPLVGFEPDDLEGSSLLNKVSPIAISPALNHSATEPCHSLIISQKTPRREFLVFRDIRIIRLHNSYLYYIIKKIRFNKITPRRELLCLHDMRLAIFDKLPKMFNNIHTYRIARSSQVVGR